MGDKAAKVQRKYLKDLQKALRNIVQDHYKKKTKSFFLEMKYKETSGGSRLLQRMVWTADLFFQLQFNQKQLKTSQSRHGSNIFKHQGFFIKDFFR